MRCHSVGCGTVNRPAISNAIGYAKFRSRSHYAVIRGLRLSRQRDCNARARGRFKEQ